MEWEVSGESDAPPIHRKVDMNLPTQEGGAWGANRRCDGNVCVRPCTSAAQFASSEWADPTSGQALTRMTGTHSMTSRRRKSSRRTGFSRATFTGQRGKPRGSPTHRQLREAARGGRTGDVTATFACGRALGSMAHTASSRRASSPPTFVSSLARLPLSHVRKTRRV